MSNNSAEAEIKEFEENFVYKDTGPDGDGFDAELPRWEDWFNNMVDQYDQIKFIERFITASNERVRRKTIEEIIGILRDEEVETRNDDKLEILSDLIEALKEKISDA